MGQLIFPQRNLNQDALQWGGAVENHVQTIANAVSNVKNDTTNQNFTTNQTITVLGNKIADVTSSIASQIATALGGISISASSITGGTLGSGITLAGPVTNSQNNTGNQFAASDLFTFNGPGFNITGTRVAAWLESATGRIGMATSSLRYKTAIVDATTDPRAILSLSVKYYQYKSEVAKRDDPTADGYIGPNYHVPTNIGMIAEDFQAAGLWEFINYQYYGLPCGEDTFTTDDEGNETRVLKNPTTETNLAGTLVLDDNGQPVCEGLHYEIFSVAVLIATQSLDARLTALEARVTALEGSK